MKDLAYYLAHTDELEALEPGELEKLTNAHIEKALESGSDDLDIEKFVGKAEDDKPQEISDKGKSETPAEEVAKAPEESQAKIAEADDKPSQETDKAEETPSGILAKDGKNIIPYNALVNARTRAEEAERLLAEQTAELEKLRNGTSSSSDKESEALTEEELNALAEDSPTLAKVLRSQQQTIQSLRGAVNELSQRSEEMLAVESAGVQAEMQAAIDNNAHLSRWQSDEDQTMWDKAAAFDKVLREMPKYRDVPFATRFNKVVELTLAEEAEEANTKQEPVATPTPPKPSQEVIRKAAEQKLAQVKTVPRSLSDIPGGSPPAVDERQKVEDMSSVALGQQFLTMTRDQLDAYLSQF